jgi:hypothetical protein
MLRKPVFWAVLGVLSAGAALFTYRYFPRAFPIVSIDLKMNRHQALAAARIMAERKGWGPDAFRQTARFSGEQEVQDFVELEAGGKDAFSRMIRRGIYAPYTWSVRHFREGETRETTVVFTPDGRPYGFTLKLPENEPGRNVPAKVARRIAETAAMRDWGQPLDTYALVEESEELRIGGRRDRTFVYERVDERIGEGTYRLSMTVSGDRLTELRHFIRIPEAFGRRFEEMRSANTTLSIVADIVAGILYVLGGCFVGMFFLMKQRRAEVRIPLIVGGVIAGFQLLSEVNTWPLEWGGYDTALTYGSFIIDHVIAILYRFAIDFALVSISLMAAEGLSRTAFPDQLQLWKLWSRNTGGSGVVLGRTAGGYLLVPLFCAYQIVLYYMTSRLHGWWTPSDTLVDPNIFAAYFPWFTSFATALHAGVWEESLFRAVPIAGGAIIGARFGKRGTGIAIALIAQALVFGAAHANYPNEPFYARAVELLLPGIGFGLLYIWFGLLPGIILHFTFDAVWLSLPLFISTSPGITGDRILMVAAALIPVWILVVRRLQNGRWTAVTDDVRNRAWRAGALPAYRAPEAAAPSTGISRRAVYGLIAAGIAGAGIWIAAARLDSDATPLRISREAAVRDAREALARSGITLGPPWRLMRMISGDMDTADRFAWRKGGKAAYRVLMERGYLNPPLWMVRAARFEGDIAARAEEYQVRVANNGAGEIRHQLPENTPGAVLSEKDARAIAEKTVQERFGLDMAKLVGISATPDRLPTRQNWEFVYAAPADNPLPDGQTRIAVDIEGSEVTQAYKYVYVPEEWKRSERERLNVLGIISSLSSIVTVILFVAGLAVSVVGWAHRRFSVALFVRIFALLFVVQLLTVINGWPDVSARFTTTEPVWNQAFIAGSIGVVGALLMALNISIINGFVGRWQRDRARITDVRTMAAGLAAGIAVAGVLAAARRLLPQYEPVWPQFTDANAFVPVAGTGLRAVMDFAKQATLYLLAFAAMEQISRGWRKNRGVLIGIIVVLGISISGSRPLDSIADWLISGAVLAAAIVAGYLFIFRHYLSLVPLAVGGIVVMNLARQAAFNAYPFAWAGYVSAVVLVVGAAYAWCRVLNAGTPGESKKLKSDTQGRRNII